MDILQARQIFDNYCKNNGVAWEYLDQYSNHEKCKYTLPGFFRFIKLYYYKDVLYFKQYSVFGLKAGEKDIISWFAIPVSGKGFLLMLGEVL